STGGIREGTILSFFPDSSVSKTILCEFIPREVIEKFKDKFRDAKDDYETCLLHIQQLVDNGEVDSVRLLLPTLIELDRQYSFQSRISKAPILAVADTAYAEDTGFADELFDLHIKFVNSNSERHRVNNFIRASLGDSTYIDSVDAQVPAVIATNDTLEGMTSALLDSISSYPASPIVLPSYYQVRDRVSVGDTFSLHASIINGGAGVAHNVRARLITPSEINITGENEFYIGDLESGEEVEVTWSLMCREAGGPVSLMIAPRADNGKFMSKTVNIMTEYTIAPEIGGVTVDSQLIEPYDYVVINAYVTGVKSIYRVYAYITRPGESYIQQVRLYDDGYHYDGESDDHLYGVRWRTPNYAKDYYISITAEDISGNTRTRGNVVGFTSKEFENANALLIVNDNLDRYEIVNDDTTIIGGDIESYYRTSLDNLGHPYDMWRTICRGTPTDFVLELYRKDGCAIWGNGIYKGSIISGLDAQNAIKWYLGREGKFFISGQDIAWGLTRNGSDVNTLLEDYLNTTYLLDDSRDYDLEGVNGDPISDGLDISISGGIGANNQRYPDVIEPTGEGTSIFNYSAGLSGGVRTEDRIVYLSFGFEGIDSDIDRDSILARVLDYFGFVGIQENETEIIHAFRIYPNPSSRYLCLTIPGSYKSSLLSIYDLSGRLLRSIDLKCVDKEGNAHSIDVSDLPAGIYFIRVETPSKKYIRKIILIR
ncbi:T9SS type A sorting domain-containing protein, partial [candidate division WOR-3 bacterium]|nr:T9SS type A sorting domain-containing protein [candidate division WOR-3 bacterium]